MEQGSQREVKEGQMIILLNFGRALMVAWIGYALLLMFAPSLLHKPADFYSGAIQGLTAFGLGYLMDRALSLVLRRRALSAHPESSVREVGE
jgi:hypothetical protein